jgi:sulfate adenylyltransferase subunit 2
MIDSLNHLESESVEIIREAYSTASNPVVLYSIGKDSTVLMHLVGKAFAPADSPIPLLHIDTTWKFADMYAHRERAAAAARMRLLVHTNQQGVEAGVNPFTSGSDYYTEVMKTEALKQALDHHRFDVIFGGARRDEERSRAKERIFSVRSAGHRWDPRNQRPELWSVYNTRIRADETLRVFPLSNWTELDVWRYIEREQLPVVPLYFAAERRVVNRDGAWLMLDDDRFQLRQGDRPEVRSVRFRTLGCYPLSAAIESAATTVGEVIAETLATNYSERQGRLIDFDQPASMEKKKQDGYF